MVDVITENELIYKSTQKIKNELFELVKGRDAEPLKAKVLFYKNELLPYFEELSKRNAFPIVEKQVPIVLGVWTPIWSTIPFHDTLPGRISEESYQIFHDDNFYANIARYAPGNQSKFLQIVSSKIPASDLMIIQKYEVKNGQWRIQNVGIFPALRNREIPLRIEDAENWFTDVVNAKFKLDAPNKDSLNQFKLENMDRNTVKKLEKTYLATPVLEHLYIDNDLRLVKTQREASQRPSYTIAVRRR